MGSFGVWLGEAFLSSLLGKGSHISIFTFGKILIVVKFLLFSNDLFYEFKSKKGKI